MAMVNERIVLDYYLEQIKEDNIGFLKGRDTYKRNIESSMLKVFVNAFGQHYLKNIQCLL